MLAYFGTAISEHITKKPNGGIICTGVPVARTGVQEYLARELRLDGDPERVIQVTREPEEVFSPAALASFEGCAVTDGHPPENVTAENFSAYVRGHAQNIRRDGEYVVADLHIDDASLASDVLNNVKRQVSCGYLCTYEPSGGGYTQKGILGNHIAIVPRGRAGASVSIKDTAQEAGKGKRAMSKFAEMILQAFGMAAKDASPEEIQALSSTAATALDAETVAAKAEPAPTQTADAPVSGLEEKLDRVLAALDEFQKKPEEKEKPKGEADLDEALKKLTGSEDEKDEKAVVIPADKAADTDIPSAAKDAAVAILRTMRPIVAAIEDEAVRDQVAGAVLSAVQGPGKLSAIDAAAASSAKKAADQSAVTSYEQRCADSQAAYAARNPHKRQEKEV